MKKKVLIVEPCASKANVFSFFSYLPLMGTLYIGTLLEREGFDVKILNENVLQRTILDYELMDADFLLLSCLTPTVNRGFDIARQYKTVRPRGVVIMGGPHVSFIRDPELELVDYVVEGEAENIILDLIKYGSDDKFVKGKRLENLDDLPFVNWSLLKGHERGSIMPIMTSRGCPFACNFCSVTSMFGRKYRAMSAARVVEEVKKQNKKYIFFYDDNFTADLGRAHQIMDGLLKLRLKPKTWTAQVRSDVVKDVELVDKMARSGCDRVFIGFESINPTTLTDLKKSQTRDDIEAAINILHKNKIKVHGMFIFGANTDNEAVTRETSAFVKRNQIDSVQYAVLTPLPGTEFYDSMDKAGRIIHKNWSYYDGLHVVFWPKALSPFKLQQLAIQSFRDFYSLAGAANEIVNFFAARAASLRNALFKAGGKFIVDRWNKLNHSYLSYLREISASWTAK